MSIEDRIPTLTDKELASLQENAMRLAQSDSAKQKADCERVLPLIDAEFAERKARAPAPAARKTSAKKAKAKA